MKKNKPFTERIKVTEDDYRNLLGASITLYGFLCQNITKKETYEILKATSIIEKFLEKYNEKTD